MDIQLGDDITIAGKVIAIAWYENIKIITKEGTELWITLKDVKTHRSKIKEDKK